MLDVIVHLAGRLIDRCAGIDVCIDTTSRLKAHLFHGQLTQSIDHFIRVLDMSRKVGKYGF